MRNTTEGTDIERGHGEWRKCWEQQRILRTEVTENDGRVGTGR